MTRIKICGMKEEAHALAAAEAGADFIGLVFAPSPRRVTLDKAKAIATAVKGSGYATETVGVFANIPSYVVNQIAGFCHLDWVQLSGDESWQYCAEITHPVIKAVRIGNQHPEEVCTSLAAATIKQKHLFLLDSQVKGKYGGTGVAFDWTRVRQAAGQFPVIIAGGMTYENVAEAIRMVAPWGVDVSSGVESGGSKDLTKMKAFIAAVRRADDKT